MKILMLVPFLPNTSMSGGQTRWYNIIKYLSQSHEITLYSLIKDESERRHIPELEKYCKKVRVFTRPKSPWTLRNLLLTSFSYYPLLVIRNYSGKERHALKKELKDGKYDLIHAETFYVMPHIPKVSVPSILVEQTIEYRVYKHYVDNEVPMILRPFLMLDVLKLRFWERYYWKKTDRLVAVSDTDRIKMQQEIPGTEVDVIPNGVDVNHFIAKKVPVLDPPRVLFVGNFKWLQNVEAIDILIEEVWPKIRQKNKKAVLWIAGRSIPARVVELADKRQDIEVTEAIEDIRDAYKAASLMLVPLRGPGGTRLKVLEAMASALPVVSTKIGVEGLDLVPGKHAVVADTPEELAAETLYLLSNKLAAKRIGLEGQKFVKKYFDWPSVVKLHDDIYAKAMKVKK